MSRIHLSPSLYGLLQNIVHKDYKTTYRTIARLLELNPGDTVLEVGCGTGILGSRFIAAGYDYWGIDLDPKRISSAQRHFPRGTFFVGDATAIDNSQLPRFQRVFIHGLLHHLNDSQCRHVINRILGLDPDVTLVIVEPFSPDTWRINPMGTLFARLDEGRFVRKQESWISICKPNSDALETFSLLPRWPVGFFAARLRPNKL